MDYPQALEFFDSFTDYEKTHSYDYPQAFSLERMRKLAGELGNPQNAYESVLIAGSNGKGSTAAILSSILRMENYRVGLYTSPHLADVAERIQVNGLSISPTRLTESAQVLGSLLNTADWRRDPPTYFEVMTAIAFRHFSQMKVHVAVLEVGLGGLYDSTNIAPAKAVGIAPISLEHTDKLGKTVSKIAVQKCGIIKGREVVVSGPQPAEAAAVILKATEAREAKLFRVGREMQVFEREYGESFQRFDLRGPLGNYYNLELGLLGLHQINNAALAIGLAKALEMKTRMKLSDKAIRQGVLDARWPGRIEKAADHPAVILDGAHNPEGARSLIEGIKRHFHFDRCILVLGVSKDKDARGILYTLLPEVSSLVATQSGHPRALEAGRLAQYAEPWGGSVLVEEDAQKAFRRARSLARPEDLILIAGSLYLIGEIRRKGLE